MIFISYNHKDQQLVDMVARQLEITFGKIIFSMIDGQCNRAIVS